MHASRRIHCLRAHRPKPAATTGEAVQNSCGCKQRCRNEQTAVGTLYTLIVMVILIAIWGVWARKDF
ncbi:Hypothetical predicted protein [Podarcis lilfordi]|uniref:Uncharacterized protein n=1 Tax=Podarcis lilfordi TaxID=74358 RepID=A0AA35KVY1_9SAUR|nr:Hypothetical predicted protein [Podarcis lilfordi]